MEAAKAATLRKGSVSDLETTTRAFALGMLREGNAWSSEDRSFFGNDADLLASVLYSQAFVEALVPLS